MKKALPLFFFFISTIFLYAQPPTFQWARKMGGATKISVGFGKSTAIDLDGNVYSVGYFEGTGDFDPGLPTAYLTAAGFTDIFVMKMDDSGNFLWAKVIGNTGYDYGSSIVVDSSGNIYVTGSFEGIVDFDPDLGVSNLISLGGSDAFVLKMDTAGNFLWVKSFGGSFGNDYGSNIALDGSGNVFTTGSFQDTVDFDPGSAITELVCVGAVDMFISKLDSLGNFIWAKRIGGNLVVQGYSIAIDVLGNVDATGIFVGTADFDPNSGSHYLTAIPGNNDIFILKLDSLGNFLWAKQIGGNYNDIGNALANDPDGNVYVTGIFQDTVDFDPGLAVFAIAGDTSNIEMFILKLDPLGNFVWAKRMAGNVNVIGTSISVDLSKNVYTTGFYHGTADFDPGAAVVALTALSSEGAFISKLNGSGNFVWVENLGGEGISINVDHNGNVYTSGFFSGSFDFNPGPGVYTMSSSMMGDIFIHKMSQEIATSSLSIGSTDNAVIIYPNPNLGSFSIDLPQVSKNSSIEIYNCFGELVYDQKNCVEQNFIDLKNQASGIYFVKIISENKIITSQKIIKQ